jgi:hypothetical protein
VARKGRGGEGGGWQLSEERHVNRTRNGTCVNLVVLVLWKEKAMYEGARWALSLERASVERRWEKNLGQNTRGLRCTTVPDTSRTCLPSGNKDVVWG